MLLPCACMHIINGSIIWFDVTNSLCVSTHDFQKLSMKVHNTLTPKISFVRKIPTDEKDVLESAFSLDTSSTCGRVLYELLF